MKRNNFILSGLLAIALVVTGCKSDKKDKEADNASESTTEKVEEVKSIKSTKTKIVELELTPKSNTNASGKISFQEKEGVVYMIGKFVGLTPGVHAIHLHEKADCSADDGTSTGGHWNPTFENHGKWGAAEGYHKGDIGNFEADKEGNGNIRFQTDEWCIGCGDEKKDIIGKAVIVHEGEDDFVSQPTGDAGGRVSCGAIIQ